MMRNMKRRGRGCLAGALLVLLLGGLGGCTPAAPAEDTPGRETPAQTVQPAEPAEPATAVPRPEIAPKLFEKHYTTSDNTLLLEVSYSLPFIQNAEEHASLEVINGFYDDEMTRLTGENLDEMLAWVKDQQTGAQNGGFPFSPHYEGVSFEEKYNEAPYISLLRTYRLYSGGAHDQLSCVGDTFNYETGGRLAAGDLFSVPEEAFRPVLLEAIFTRMEAAGMDNYYPGFDMRQLDGCFDPDRFYLTEEGVVWFFLPYEIAPYAAGLQEFLIPRAELSDILSIWS